MGALKMALYEPQVSCCLYATVSSAGTFSRWREFGKAMGLSQRDVATAAHTSQGYISKLENGAVRPKRWHWPKLMKAYRVSSETEWASLLNAARAEWILKHPVRTNEPLMAFGAKHHDVSESQHAATDRIAQDAAGRAAQ